MNKLQKTHALKSALDTELDKLSHAVEKQDRTKLSQDQVEKLRKQKVKAQRGSDESQLEITCLRVRAVFKK